MLDDFSQGTKGLLHTSGSQWEEVCDSIWHGDSMKIGEYGKNNRPCQHKHDIQGLLSYSEIISHKTALVLGDCRAGIVFSSAHRLCGLSLYLIRRR